jgi:tetratricopeptide (TPR) repeat protein
VLIRDVAYAALPKAERADLHERYAFWLEEQPTGSDEIIGYHLEQAHSCLTALGQAGNRRYELGVRTSERLAAAGRVALDREDVRAAANLLARALALDEGGASVSLRLDLADALENSGQLEEAIAKATEAADRALACGDDAGAFRARLHAAGIALSQTWDSTSVASLLKLVEEAERVFEDAGDDRGLADASRITVAAEMERCRYGAGIAVLNKAADHARRAGELRQERHILAEIGDAHLYGPTPVRDALAWLDEQGSAFNRNPQIVLTRATLQAMLGEFDDARRLVAVSSAQLAELGMHSGRGVHKRWYVETLAGDHAAAEAEARRVSEMLEQMGARAHRSTVTCELAWSLCALGRDKEAETTVALGEELSASEDVINQVFLRQVRARLLVRAGRRDLAEDMAREAVAMVEKTDVLGAHGDALIDLADVLCLGDGAERAIPVVETALQLYEAKGTLVMARRARALLDQLHETA